MDDFNLNFSILQDDEQQLGFGKKEQRQKITWLPQVEKKESRHTATTTFQTLNFQLMEVLQYYCVVAVYFKKESWGIDRCQLKLKLL